MTGPRAQTNLHERTAANARPGTASGRLPISPVQVLVACGWLNAADAGDPRLRVEALTRSHQVCRVTAPDGRSAIVKQPTHQGLATGRSLAHEMCVYRLANWMPALAQALPTPILIDEAHQVLVLESLATGHNFPDDTDVVAMSSSGIALQLGRAMAGWHRETKDITLEPSLAAGILQLPDALEVALEDRSASAKEVMRAIAADAEFSAALRDGAALYRHECLIHGDIRPDNWLVRPDATQTTLEVIDWELSGLGDPAWDVGSACAETILQAIRSGAPWHPGGWPDCAEPTLREFLCAYHSAGGGFDILDTASLEWVVLCTVCRLLHVACEWAEYAANVGDGLVDQITGQARDVLHIRRHAAARLAQWVAA